MKTLPRKELFKIVLVLLIILSSLLLIFSTHLSRDRFNRFEQLKRVERQHMVSWHRLLLEQSAWSSLLRVEKMATQRMKMHVPIPAEIQVVSNE